MGTKTRGFWFFIIQFIIYEVSTQHQPPVGQYVLSNGHTNGPPGFIPTSTTGPRPNIPLSLPNLAGPPPLTSPIQTTLNKPLVPKQDITSGPLDKNVLNNLAIALQLLIVSNIMNMPAEPEPIIPNLANLSKYESPVSYSVSSILEQALSNPLYSYEAQSKPLYSYEAQSKPLYSYEAQSKPLYSYEAQSKPLYSYEAQSKPLYSYETQPKPLYSYEAQLPNANFLGSSGFTEPVNMFGPSVSTVRPNPRSSMTLMSPYDALGTSLFADPMSSFPSSYSKKDFQSPYASIIAADGARDLLSVSDLF